MNSYEKLIIYIFVCPFTHAHKQLTHNKQNCKHIEEFYDFPLHRFK